MLRLATLFWLALAVAVGLLLYNVKHEVQGLEQHLARTNRAIAATHERIHVLHAEWSLLNEPDRLRALATRHLDLVPVRPAQLVQPQVIAGLPEAQPHGTTALAEATPPAPPAAAAPPAQPASAPRAAEEKPARIAPRREEPLPPPRMAAPQPRRELEARGPRPLMPETGVAPRPVAVSPVAPTPVPAVVVTAAPPPVPSAPPPGAAVSALGRPSVSLPPPVPVTR